MPDVLVAFGVPGGIAPADYKQPGRHAHKVKGGGAAPRRGPAPAK